MPLLFSRAAARHLDHAAIHDYGIPGIVLMENAAIALTYHALALLAAAAHPSVLIIAGPGNNGGDGYAAARHLHNHAIPVSLMPIGLPREPSDAHTNFLICRKMNLPFVAHESRHSLPPFSLIIDALFGTGLDRPPTQPAASIILWVNTHAVGPLTALSTPNAQRHLEAGILAADIPSGLDCDTGLPFPNPDGSPSPALRASATVTFAGLKLGFANPASSQFTGTVHVAPIGCPVELLARFGKLHVNS